MALSDDQFKQLRTLILDQSVKIEALALEVRALKRAMETTEVVCLVPEEMGDPIDVPDDLKKFFPD